MQVGLMHPEQAFDWRQPLSAGTRDLAHDLALDGVIRVMSADDPFVAQVMERAVLHSVADPQVIRYRQGVLADVLAYPHVIRAMYDLVVETLEKRRRHFWGGLATNSSSQLQASLDLIVLMMESLVHLREVARDSRELFGSEGLCAFIRRVEQDLSDEYLNQVRTRLRDLRFKNGLRIGMRLGHDGKGVGSVLRGPEGRTTAWQRLARREPSHSFRIADRDESGYRALVDIQNRGLRDVATTVVQAAEHMVGFFLQLKAELAFYLGCARLVNRLKELQLPLCVPDPVESGSRVMRFDGLYDVALALDVGGPVVSNRLDAEGVSLLVVTGANQGGKSTFLRSMGLAQLLMQCGMYVPATAYEMEVATGVYSHFTRLEDAGMDRGKLDDELTRISQIVEIISPGSLLLMNESFAATNEREGAAIARGVVEAFVDSGVKVVFVTHLWACAEEWYRASYPRTVFLRAERLPDGQRSFKIIAGAPLETSFGADLYRQIFAEDEDGDDLRCRSDIT